MNGIMRVHLVFVSLFTKNIHWNKLETLWKGNLHPMSEEPFNKMRTTACLKTLIILGILYQKDAFSKRRKEYQYENEYQNIDLVSFSRRLFGIIL